MLKLACSSLRLVSLACGALTWLAAPGAHALDLLQAYEAALTHDASLRATRAGAEASRERVPMARAQLLPNVSLGIARNRNALRRTQENLFGQVSTTSESYYSHNQSLTLRQPLLRRSANVGLEQAMRQVEDSDAVLDVETRNLAVRVATVYLDALLARDRADLLEVQARGLEAQWDAARKGFAAGSGTRTDIDEVQARRDLNRAQRLEALQTVEMGDRQLRLLTGLSSEQPLHGVDGQRLLEAVTPLEALEIWIDRAHQHNPELRALEARVEVARLEIDKARAGHWPTLDAVIQVTRSGSETVTSPSSSYTNRTVGLQLNVPLYQGGQVSAGVRMALASLTQAEERLEAARRELGVRVQQAHRGVTEGLLKIQAFEQAVRSSEQLVRSSERSKLAGARSTLDVLNAESQLQVARRDLADARYDYLLARIQLAVLAGEDLPNLMRTINGLLSPRTSLS